MAFGYSAPREIKLLSQPLQTIAEDGIFDGYASLFGIADLGKDVVVPVRFAPPLPRVEPAIFACSGSMIRRNRLAAGSPSRRTGAVCGFAASSTSRSSGRAISMR